MTEDIINQKAEDIIKLVKAGATTFIIILVLSSKYKESISLELVKSIRQEFFIYHRNSWKDRTTGVIYPINDDLMEISARKILGMEDVF